MRLKIDIDDALMNEAFSCTKAKTVTELIHEPLKEFVRIKKRKDLTELAGQIQFRQRLRSQSNADAQRMILFDI